MDGYRVGLVPAALGRSGTTATATPSATSGAATPVASARWPRGWPAPRTCTPTTAARRTPRSTSSPPTTASRCATWSSYEHQAQRGQRRAQPRRHRQPPLAGTTGVEGETDDPAICALRRRQAANLMATLCLSNGVADDHRRRRARPHPARQQQRLRARTTRSRGSTGAPTTRGSTSTRSPRPRCGCGASTRRCGSGTTSTAPRRSRAAPRTWPGSHPDRPRDGRGGLVRRRSLHVVGMFVSGRPAALPRPARRAAAGRVVPDLAQRRLRAGRADPLPATQWVEHGEVVLSTDDGLPPSATPWRAGDVAGARPAHSILVAPPDLTGGQPRADRTVRGADQAGGSATRPSSATEASASLRGQHPHGVAEGAGVVECRRRRRSGAGRPRRPPPGASERRRRADAARPRWSITPCTTWTSTSSGVQVAERRRRPARSGSAPTSGASPTPLDSTWSTRTAGQAVADPLLPRRRARAAPW